MDSLLLATRQPPTLVEGDVLGRGASAISVCRATVVDPGGFRRLHRGMAVALKKVAMPARDSSRGVDAAVRIEREVAMLRSFRHPHIVQCYGVVQLDRTTLGILLELCDGNSLRRRYLESGPLDASEVASTLFQVLLGVQYLHAKEIVHRDIKGLNVLSSNGVVKLADFGSASNLKDQDDGQFHSLQGTLHWLPPECFALSNESGGGTPADIWSIGALCLELARGAMPFPQFDMPFALMRYITEAESDESLVPDDGTLPPELLRFIRRCLRRDPSQRPTATELLADPFIAAAAGGTAAAAGGAAIELPTYDYEAIDKLHDARQWWADAFGGGGGVVPARQLFAALRCEHLEHDLLPILMFGSASPPGPDCLVTEQDFLRFMNWFGPFSSFRGDATALEQEGYGSSNGYSAECAYSNYASSDDVHVLLTLLSKPWMQPLLDQRECESRMQHCAAGTFVVRFTSRYAELPGGFTLSVRGEHGVLHYRILRPDDGFSFIITPPKSTTPLYFDTLDDLVDHLTVHGIRSQKSATIYKLTAALSK